MIELPFPPAKRRRFSQFEIERLCRDYRKYVEAGKLDELATEMGRSKSVLCEKAAALRLTNAQAARVRAAAISKAVCAGVPKWAERPHPKGMAGKQHSDETKATLRNSSLAAQSAVSDNERTDRTARAMRTRIERHGSLVSNHKAGSWRAGWREIGGKRNYYRSRWEANYARYLEWLKSLGEIRDWQHEPETFWFEAIKRGVRSYLPDFRVWENDGTTKLHEVKGWMDSRSKTTLARMKKYHPGETIIVIREKEYNAIARQVGRMTDGWEHSDRSDRL